MQLAVGGAQVDAHIGGTDVFQLQAADTQAAVGAQVLQRAQVDGRVGVVRSGLWLCFFFLGRCSRRLGQVAVHIQFVDGDVEVVGHWQKTAHPKLGIEAALVELALEYGRHYLLAEVDIGASVQLQGKRIAAGRGQSEIGGEIGQRDLLRAEVDVKCGG